MQKQSGHVLTVKNNNYIRPSGSSFISGGSSVIPSKEKAAKERARKKELEKEAKEEKIRDSIIDEYLDLKPEKTYEKILWAYRFIENYGAASNQDVNLALSYLGDGDTDYQMSKNYLTAILNALCQYKFIKKTGTGHSKWAPYSSLDIWELKLLLDPLWQNRFLKAGFTDDLTERISSVTSKETIARLKEIAPEKEEQEAYTDSQFLDSYKVVLNAILENKKAEFWYGRLDEKRRYDFAHSKKHNVIPLKIFHMKGFYYLLGYNDLSSEHRDQPRIFRIDRMTEAREVTSRFGVSGGNVTREKKLYIDNIVNDFISNNTDNYIGGKRMDVIVEWDPLKTGTSPSVLFDVMGSTVQKYGNLGDEFRFSTYDNDGLYNNLLKLGSLIRIKEPEVVVNKYVKKLRDAASLYDSSPEDSAGALS